MAERKKASVEIQFLDSNEQIIEPPIIFDLATNYTIQALVTNNSVTAGGHPYEVDLEVGFGVSIGNIDILPYSIQPQTTFAPDGIQISHKRVYIPREYVGLPGMVIARVYDPLGKMLASAQKRFEVGYEISPDAGYEITGDFLMKNGIDMPFLNPDDGLSDEVVMGGVGSKSPPPPPRPPKQIDYSKSQPPPGIDTTSEPEPEPEFDGETVTSGGRMG